MRVIARNEVTKQSRSCLINGKAVIPAEAGIQAVNLLRQKVGNLGPGFRRGDDNRGIYEMTSSASLRSQ